MVPYSSNVVCFPAGQFLVGRAANATSQFGCDGLIEATFERIGTENKWCFEVGASDGLLLSNTHRLRGFGWNAVLIEADPYSYARLCDQRSDKVTCVHERIDGTSLDRGLAAIGCPRDMDFGCIDIDGQDYHAWNGMQVYRPRVMLVEFDYGSDPNPEMGRNEVVDFVPEVGGVGQATYLAIKRLGESKGYTALAKTTVNLLFVRSELC